MTTIPNFSTASKDVQAYMRDFTLIPVADEVASGEKPFFTSQEKNLVCLTKIPLHIAIIPDGNRRWAAAHNRSFAFGYAKGAHSLVETALAAKELGIKWMTMYTFSTENWKRPKIETDVLMHLIESHLLFYEDAMRKAGITIDTIGDLSCVPLSLQKTLEKLKKTTAQSPRQFTLTLAINYGGRDELLRAFHKIITNIPKEELSYTLNEQLIAQFLDTCNIPDPELIIRASGEKRLSNFLLWQSSYSEVYIENSHWPDYSPRHLFEAILDYQGRERRMGGKGFQVSL